MLTPTTRIQGIHASYKNINFNNHCLQVVADRYGI